MQYVHPRSHVTTKKLAQKRNQCEYGKGENKIKLQNI